MPTIIPQKPPLKKSVVPAPKPVSRPGARPAAKATGTSIVDRIKPIGFADDDGLKVLIFGRSGTGKTTFWSTFPDKILSIICSGSSRPGETRSIDTVENRGRIDQVVLQSTEEIPDLLSHAATAGYRTVVLDHATGMQDLRLKEILGLDECPPQKSWGLATKQQYGQCSLFCKTFLRNIINLPLNAVIIAQERDFTREEDAAVAPVTDAITPCIGASMSPSVTGWLNTAVDYICQTYIRDKMEAVTRTTGVGKLAREVTVWQKVPGVEFCLRTEQHPVITTKFRLPKGTALPDAIVNPTYDKIMEIIRAGRQ